uniref:Scm like with four mbt domains 2 n=1 Tax=Poecilia reticulata TaxID=8081 RepID=A0A3P9PZM9_POERE
GAESLEEEFMWEEYLEETGATAAPHTIFRHVEVSLQSSFQPGMKLEVASKSRPETYWVATIITTCGQLLLLRYSGYGDDRRADFWCDVMTAQLHAVGWCAQNHKTLTPPEAIREKYSDWTEFLVQDLTGSRTAPASLLEGPLRGKNTVDLIVAGSVLELQNLSDPLLYWPVRVVQNVGGRLRLRPVGLSERHRAQDTWLFYLDVRLRPLGWALENQLTLEPPAELRPLLGDRDWQQALQDAQADGQEDALPLEVFKDHADLPRHAFRAGMKLEMVSPWEQLLIRPVSVTKVYSDTYFQVTLDDLCADAAPRSAVCHANSPGILPVQWCLKNGVALERPRGYEGPDFDWADYLKQSGSEAAPDTCFPDTGHTRGFAEDMWLEAVNPARPEEVCVARVSQVRGRLLWLRLEGVLQPRSECIVDVESMDVFPVGWCEANSYPLTPPLRPACTYRHSNYFIFWCLIPALNSAANGRYCCSRVFVNHRCFSGPYLNKGRIAELPRAVGPGKCSLVLKELLSMLINAAYKPGRVLKELQQLQEPGWDSQEETLKAKYKGKTYRSTVRIVRLAEQIPDFCRKVCVKLQCCPNLLGPDLRADSCPENCSVQTKTKYTYYYGKKRRLSKAVDGDEAKPARRRRKRKAIFVQKKRLTVVMVTGVRIVWLRPVRRRPPASRRAAALDPIAVRLQPEQQAAAQRRQGETETPTCRSGLNQNQNPAVRDGQLVLDRNPLEWSVDEVVKFINSTDCAALANVFKEQDIDGQALLLLTLPTVQECMDLKLGPAIKLCHQIERVKVAFYKQFA